MGKDTFFLFFKMNQGTCEIPPRDPIIGNAGATPKRIENLKITNLIEENLVLLPK